MTSVRGTELTNHLLLKDLEKKSQDDKAKVLILIDMDWRKQMGFKL
jgi:hypothetical protein